MPDITMCTSDNCPLRHNCYRSPESGTVPNGERQSWSLFRPTIKAGVGVECAHYDPLIPKSRKK